MVISVRLGTKSINKLYKFYIELFVNVCGKFGAINETSVVINKLVIGYRRRFEYVNLSNRTCAICKLIRLEVHKKCKALFEIWAFNIFRLVWEK